MVGLGCAKNLVDAEVMLGHLVERGVEVTPDLDDAEVVIVNTCGFIEDAKRESVEAILEIAAAEGDGEAAPAGGRRLHGAALRRRAAAEIPEIDAFVGLDELERVPEAVLGALGRDHLPDQRGALKLYDHTAPRLLATGGVFAYLKVAEGCDNPCTFCHIPRMRGRFRSRPLASLVEEARRLEERRCAGARPGGAGHHPLRRGPRDGPRPGCGACSEALLAGTGLPWIRFLYAYPATLDERIFRSDGAREPAGPVPRHPAPARLAKGAQADEAWRRRAQLTGS